MSNRIRLGVCLLLLLVCARPAAAQGGTFTLSLDTAVNGYVIGPGIDCGAGRSDCFEVFAGPTTILLSAVPNPGYVFLGWAGLDCIGAETIVVLVNRPKVCRPVFNASPEGPGVEVPNYASNVAFLDLPFGTGDVTPPGGRSQLVFAPPYGQVVPVFATTNAVVFRIDHPALTNTTVRLTAAQNESLSPGLFEPTTGSLFTLVEPLLHVTYNNLACTSHGGRFRIYEITFAGPTLSAFSADFEVACPNGGIATGSIRYNAARASLLPFDGVYPSSTLTLHVTLGGYVTSTGIDCGDGGRTDCEEAFEPPSIASLHATASPGYEFLGWGGICGGSDPTLTMTVNTSGRCLAAFYPVADAPSHPFGQDFLIIDRPGAIPSRSVWLPPEGLVSAAASGSFVGFVAEGTSGTAGVNFGVRAGQIVAGDYDAVPNWDVEPYVLDRRPARITLSGCSVTRGFFRVYEASYGVDGRLVSFAADFEAYCSGSPTYVAGAVRYRASRDIVVPFDGAYPVVRLSVAPSPYGRVVAPGIVCDATASDCAELYASATFHSIHAIPNPGYAFAGWTGDCSGGSYTQVFVDRTTWCDPLFRAARAGLPEDMRLSRGALTIQSHPGDPIGSGVLKTYVINAWSVLSDEAKRTLTVSPGYTDWRMEFRAPAAGVLGAGSYEGAVGMFGAPELPGLSIRRVGSLCDSSAITGRFTIYELRFRVGPGTVLESLAIDFEQRCNNGPALRGSIRFRSSRSILQPFAGEATHSFSRFDFNGDQSPDLVWQNVNDGRLLVWQLSGIDYTFNEPPSIPQLGDTNWHIVGTADADSDGYNDLYWQHQTTGALAIWYMRDTQIVSTQMLTPGAVSDTGWQIRTIFDVDRDGQPDLIWQHRVSGHIAVWYMNAGTFRSAQLIGPGQIADPNWTIVGGGDADGDGHYDLYWHHPTTGQLAIWYMNGVQLLSTQMLTPSTVADTNWRVRGIADINRDGSPDVVWQNVSTSDVAVWMMSGSHLVESRLIGGPTMPAAEWVLVGPR